MKKIINESDGAFERIIKKVMIVLIIIILVPTLVGAIFAFPDNKGSWNDITETLFEYEGY
jgi:hypothetical protein